MPSRTGLRALWIIGAILLIGGIALTGWRWAHPVVSGWFAYAPLSNQHLTLTATPDWAQVVGYICSVLGALAIGISIGIRLHRG